jgi:general secretion pathway protein B
VSFILDALRKSEARRRMGESPDIHNGVRDNTLPPRKRRVGPMLVVAGLVVVGFFAVAGLFYLNQDRVLGQLAQWADRGGEIEPAVVEHEVDTATRPEHRETAGRVESPDSYLPRERIVSDPAEIDAELARMTARGEQDVAEDDSIAEPPAPVIDRRGPAAMQPRTSVVAEAPEGGRTRPQVNREQEKELQRQLEQQREQVRQRAWPTEPVPETSARDTPSQVAATPADAQPWRPGGAEYVRAWELPLSVRRNMPELKLTIHVFAAEEHSRFVLVNGQRFVIGEMISDGVRLVDIRREGAVVDYRDYRFLLEP